MSGVLAGLAPSMGSVAPGCRDDPRRQEHLRWIGATLEQDLGFLRDLDMATARWATTVEQRGRTPHLETGHADIHLWVTTRTLSGEPPRRPLPHVVAAASPPRAAP